MSSHKLTGRLIEWLNTESNYHGVPLCDFERFRHELKPCDVILVEGRSRVSTMIRLITASPWTHAALYIGRLHDIEDATLQESLKNYSDFPPNEQLIIESVLGKGTIVNRLSFYKKDHIRICRPTGLAYQDAQQVIRYAISRLGAEYDVRQIFDLARFLFPWFLLPRRWRSSLFRRSADVSTTRTVCSTMIAEAFGFIQFPILPLVKKVGEHGVQLFRRNPKICVPSDFDYSPHFEIIKYPFIDLGLHKDYRLLPWKGSGRLSQEEASLYFENQDTLSAPPSASPNADAHEKDDQTPPSKPNAEPNVDTLLNTDKTRTTETIRFIPVSSLRRVANRLEDALPMALLRRDGEGKNTVLTASSEQPHAETALGMEGTEELSGVTATAQYEDTSKDLAPNQEEQTRHDAPPSPSEKSASTPPQQKKTSTAKTPPTEQSLKVPKPSSETPLETRDTAKHEASDSAQLNNLDVNESQERVKKTSFHTEQENKVEGGTLEKWLKNLKSTRLKTDD